MTDLTLGVEEELQLVDRRSGKLCGVAREVIEKADGDRDGALEDVGGVEPEMQLSQLEIVTPICDSLGEVRSQLVRLRGVASEAAAESGCRLVSAGTNPGSRWADQQVTPGEPYEQIHEVYAQLGREQIVFGCHVHVAIDDPELRIQAMNHLRPWLPTLLALSASSPFWEGEDTGYASYRYLVFNRWPTFLTPGTFEDWAAYQAHVDLLVETGTIDAPGRVYWTVRPSATFDTLEFRVCDACTTVDEAVLVTGLIRALVATSLDRARRRVPVPDVRQELVRAAEWRAARWGLSGELVDLAGGRSAPAVEVVGGLLDHLRPGLEETGDRDEVVELLDWLLSVGTSAERQRSQVPPGGGAAPTAVIDHLAAETALGDVPEVEAAP